MCTAITRSLTSQESHLDCPDHCRNPLPSTERTLNLNSLATRLAYRIPQPAVKNRRQYLKPNQISLKSSDLFPNQENWQTNNWQIAKDTLITRIKIKRQIFFIGL